VLRQSTITLDARSVLDGWQKLLALGALVFLPVPALTATGLAVPIPSLVYRVAAGLAAQSQEIVGGLPGFHAVVADSPRQSRKGVIRLSAAERVEETASAQATTPSAEAPATSAGGTDKASGGGAHKVSQPGHATAPAAGNQGSNESPAVDPPPASTAPTGTTSPAVPALPPPPAIRPPPPPPRVLPPPPPPVALPTPPEVVLPIPDPLPVLPPELPELPVPPRLPVTPRVP
jgi:hypothetical protein